jgi:hypothetical protein
VFFWTYLHHKEQLRFSPSCSISGTNSGKTVFIGNKGKKAMGPDGTTTRKIASEEDNLLRFGHFVNGGLKKALDI